MNFDDRILSRDEIDALSLDALDGDTEALPLLIETHLRLFYKMAQKYKNILDPDESVSIMVENVIEKFPHKFKPDKGNFTKFAKWYAFHGIQWYLKFMLRVVHFPQREDDKIISNVECSQDESPYEKTSYVNELEENIVEEHKEYTRRLVMDQLYKLEPLEREVLKKRFAIYPLSQNVRPKLLREIGEDFGKCSEWVRQKINSGLEKIKPWAEENQDDFFFD